jgi:hypothetical protein
MLCSVRLITRAVINQKITSMQKISAIRSKDSIISFSSNRHSNLFKFTISEMSAIIIIVISTKAVTQTARVTYSKYSESNSYQKNKSSSIPRIATVILQPTYNGL